MKKITVFALLGATLTITGLTLSGCQNGTSVRQAVLGTGDVLESGAQTLGTATANSAVRTTNFLRDPFGFRSRLAGRPVTNNVPSPVAPIVAPVVTPAINPATGQTVASPLAPFPPAVGSSALGAEAPNLSAMVRSPLTLGDQEALRTVGTTTSNIVVDFRPTAVNYLSMRQQVDQVCVQNFANKRAVLQSVHAFNAAGFQASGEAQQIVSLAQNQSIVSSTGASDILRANFRCQA